MSTRKSLAWAFNQQVFQYVIQFAGSVVIARLLTPGEIGIFSLAMAASGLIASLRNFGVGTYLIQERDLNAEKIRTAFGVIVLISWSLGLLIFLGRNLMAELYESPGIASVMIVLAVNFLVVPLGQTASALLSREMRFDVLHHITLLGTAVGTGTSIAMAFLGFSYMALAWGLLLGSLARALALFTMFPRQMIMRPSFQYWRDVVSFGGFMTANSIGHTVNEQGLKFVLGGWISPGAVALFERAEQLPKLVQGTLTTPMVRVLVPAFSKNLREGASIGPGVVKLIAAKTVVVWPFFLTLGFLAVPVIVFLFGDNWRIAGEILPYILVAGAIQAVVPDPGQILIPHGRVKKLALVTAVTALSNLLLSTVGALYSLEIFAMLRPIQGMIALAIAYFAVRHYWQIDAVAVRRVYAQAVAVTAISALPAVGVVSVFGGSVPIWALLAVAASAPVLWLFGIYVTNHPLRQEIATVLHSGLSALSLKKGG